MGARVLTQAFTNTLVDRKGRRRATCSHGHAGWCREPGPAPLRSAGTVGSTFPAQLEIEPTAFYGPQQGGNVSSYPGSTPTWCRVEPLLGSGLSHSPLRAAGLKAQTGTPHPVRERQPALRQLHPTGPTLTEK